MKHLILLILFNFLPFQYLFSQEINDFCGLDTETYSLQKTTSISSYVPTTGTLRILVVLCKFVDDNFDLSPHTDLWPHTLNSMPSWGPNLVSTSSTYYYNPSMTGYFKTMSNNNFNVIGDVVFYQPQHNQSYYFISSGRHIGYLTEEILTAINPSINYANYDNNGDGKVDMIQICFRFADTYELDYKAIYPNDPRRPHYQGIAGLTGSRQTFASGSSLTLDGKTISASYFGSGTFQNGIMDLHSGLPVMAHEFGHYLFGGVHYAGVGFHGLMDGSGTGVMSSFERIKVGWVTPTTVGSNITNVLISDALTTNVIYKIPIAGTDNYFLVDNHQRLNYYESSWKKYNGGPLVSPGTGILISHCSTSSIDLESAFGRWNWKTSGNYYIYPFETESVNRNFGLDKLNLRGLPTTAGLKNDPDYLGSLNDFMKPGFFEIFSPWSNPSTYPDTSSLCIELVSIDQSKVAHLNFYTQNAIQTKPSKPQNLKLAVVNNHPVLTWEANIEPDLVGYNIYRAENGGAPELIGYVSQAGRKTFTDYTANTSIPSDNYDYTIKAKDNTALLSVQSDKVSIMALAPKISVGSGKKMPSEYILEQNYPNPFNPTTLINYSVKEAGLVKIKVYDVLGSEITELVNEAKEAGYHSIEFSASNLPSGVYIYTLQVNGFSSSNKMLLLK